MSLTLVPAALCVVLEAQPFTVQNQIDPFAYVGYTEGLPDLVDR